MSKQPGTCNGCRLQYYGTGEICYYCLRREASGPLPMSADKSNVNAIERSDAVNPSMDRNTKLTTKKEALCQRKEQLELGL